MILCNLVFVMMFALCGSQGVMIRGCKKGTIDVFDDGPSTVTCDGIPPGHNVGWYLNHPNPIEIGSCETNGSCKVVHTNQVYNFSRSKDSKESHMTIWSDQRNFKNLSLYCMSGTGQTRSENCSLIIKSHPVLQGCSITQTSDTVIGSCRVTRAYSSDGQYRCLWKLNDDTQNVSQPENTELTNDTGREYLKDWTCYFTQPLPEEEGAYIYTISTDPPPEQEYSQTIKTGLNSRNGQDGSHSVLPTWVIIGVSSAVLVMTVIAIVAVCITRRRRCQEQNQGLSKFQEKGRIENLSSERVDYVRMQTTTSTAKEDKESEFEEQINVIYGGYGGQSPDNKDGCGGHIDAVYARVDKSRLKTSSK